MLKCCPWFTPAGLFEKCRACCCPRPPTQETTRSGAAAEEEEAAAGGAPTAAWAEDDDEKKAAEEDAPTVTATATTTTSAAAPPPAPEERFLEKFYGGPYADMIIKQAKPIVAFYVLLFVVAVIVSALCVEPATQQQPFFTEDHFYMRTQDVVAEKFGLPATGSVAQIEVQLGFGLKRNDPWDLRNVHPCEVSDETRFMKTRSKLKDGFDLANHQQAFSTACSTFASKLVTEGAASATNYYCWIDQFKDWAMEKG